MEWFSFDGLDFETHATEAEAAESARRAMQFWSDSAADGWDELSTAVCYGRITHAVGVHPIDVTDENSHQIPPGCDGLEEHTLERIAPTEHRCNICGGVVTFDGTPPVPGNWGGR